MRKFQLQLLLSLTLMLAINQTSSAQIVISQVYGGGGNSGATYTNDFIEIFNRGTSSVNLSGWSVQYASATGTSWSVTNLSGSIAPGQYYLIQEAAGTGGTTSLPTPDATGTIAMSGSAGKVALVNSTTALTGSGCPFGASVIDFVGYGTTANCFEGAATTPAPSNTTSVLRAGNGCTDANNNATDFATGAPNPRNTATALNPCSGPPVLSVSVAAGTNAAEPATNGTFNLTLSGSAPVGGITVTYTLAGSAAIINDYTDPQSGTVTIPAGNNTGLVTLTVSDDLDVEGTETIQITLTGATSPAVIGTALATINLADNDVPVNPYISLISYYSQDFNTLANTGTSFTVPAGWLFAETGTNTNTLYTAGTGSSNSGDTYSFGAASSTERAFGSVLSGSLASTIGAQVQNNSGTIITKLKISYTGEEWRLGTAARTDRLAFQYSLDATSLSNGTWISVNNLDFTTPNTATTGAKDGNAAGNNRSITYTIRNLSIPNGTVFLIRWTDTDASGADDGLAVDDLTIEANPIDLIPPVLNTVNPVNGATDVSLNISASAQFNEEVQKGTGDILIKRSSDNSIFQTININAPAVTVSSSAVNITLNNLEVNTGYYIEIDNGAITDLEGNSFAGISGSSTWAFRTGIKVYVANFQNCTSALTDGFTQFSQVGAIVWGCTTFGRDPSAPAGTAPFPNGVQINGFSGGTNVPNTDWLISPAFDLTGTTYPLLSFWSRTAFNGLPLQLKVSTDYISGDPTLATWTDINGKFPGQTSNIWTLSENINLSAFKQPNVHFAFVYFSDDDDGARWTIDDVSLGNSPVPPPPSLTVNTTDIQFAYTANGGNSTKTFSFTGNDLTNDITLNAAGPFTLSKDGAAFSPSLLYTVAEANNVSQTVYVRFSPNQNNQNFAGSISAATGSLSASINLAGTSIDPATTLEVVNWNIEWFGSTVNGPTNDAQQEQNVKTILQNLDADVYALSEMVSEARLASVVSQMPGYAYVISNYGSHTNTSANPPTALAEAQKLVFIYKTSVLSNISTTALVSQGINSAADLTNPAYNYFASGRFPYMLNADVTLNCITKNVKFVLVHGKANTSPTATSYDRRKRGADTLYYTLQQNYANDNVIILGDFNDDLDVTITAGINPPVTSYSIFTNDAVNFSALTLPLSIAGKKSTVAYNDVIDHVVASNEMQPYYMTATANILTDAAALVSNYGSTTSDHYPVFSRYQFEQPPPPVITCPGNIAQNNDPGTCGAVVNYTITFEGNCGEATLQQTTGLASGSVFPVGTTTNTFVVTDAAGGTATCSFTVTITDSQKPTINCPGNITSNTGPGVCNATVNYSVTFADNCSGATIQQTAGLASGSIFPAGTTTNTFVVTDASGNTETCSFTVTVTDTEAPSFTRPADKTILFATTCSYDASTAITGDVTNEQDNCSTGLNATYTDLVVQCGNDVIISRTWRLSDNSGNHATPQVQTITVSDNVTPYIIYAQKEAQFGEYNYINGSVGVTASNGKATFKKGTVLLSPDFVRAKKIEVSNGANIQTKIFSPANDGPNPPFYFFSGSVNGLPDRTIHSSTLVPVSANYKVLKIKENVTVTVTGTLYGKIEIEEGANVTFTPTGGILNIENLEIEGCNSTATIIRFGGCTSVRIKNKVELEEHVELNVGGPKVTFYLGDNNNDDEEFNVEGGKNKVSANVYIKKGKLKVEGENSSMTTMTGWFIAETVQTQGKNITWNSNSCNAPAPLTNHGAITKNLEEFVPAETLLTVDVMPNPSSGYFTLLINSNDKSLITVRISDLSGKVMGVQQGITPGSRFKTGSELKAGIYFAEVIQGKERKVVKLIKIE